MTEPASVVAARQLAEEAQARRSTIECATSVVTSDRTPHSVRTRRARAALLAVAAAATTGCAAGPDTACALVYYSPGLQVVLDGWPPAVDRVVEVECEGCDPATLEGAATLTARPGADGVAELGLPLHAPEVIVRVLEGDVVLSEMTVDPDYRSIDGDSECPGPSGARIVVPAP